MLEAWQMSSGHTGFCPGLCRNFEQDPTAGSQPGGDKDMDDHLL